MANRCERCGDRYYEECVTCRDAIRALDAATGSHAKSEAIMKWVEAVAAKAVLDAAHKEDRND